MPTGRRTDDRCLTNADVVVVGEALVDIVVSSRGTVEHPGGSPANVAYGLGRLGVDTALLTSIGDDHHAAAIETHLRSAGVRLVPGSKGSGSTATATAVSARDGSAQYNFNIRWDLPQVAPAFLHQVLHTGSIATFLAPGAASVRELIKQAYQDCVVTYDPNIRPALLGSHAEARTIFEELVPFTEVVKLSDEDARWLYPRLALDRGRRSLHDCRDVRTSHAQRARTGAFGLGIAGSPGVDCGNPYRPLRGSAPANIRGTGKGNPRRTPESSTPLCGARSELPHLEHLRKHHKERTNVEQQLL